MTTRWSTSPRTRTALAALAGALPVLAFPAPGLWWWAYAALVPWLLLVRTAPTGKRAVYEGWAGGFGFMLAMHHWLLPSLNVFTFVIAGLLGALWGPWGWLVRRLLGTGLESGGSDDHTGRGRGEPGGEVLGAEEPGRGMPGEEEPSRDALTPTPPTRKQTATALLVLPSAWLLVELVRSWQGLGGPWGMLGASQWQVEPALRLASVGGVWLLSFLVIAVNTALAILIAVPASRTPALAALLATATATSAAYVGAPRPETTGRTRIAVVQAGVIDGPDRRFDREEQLTRQLIGQDVDLIVWGESSVGYDLKDRPDLAGRLAALSGATGADILVNVDARRSDRPGIYKSSILVGPDGPTGDRYDKMRLVPFGEYIPARSLLGWATSVGKAAGEDRKRGTRQVLMDVGDDLRIGPMVCFETAFPDMSRSLARKGADILVAQSSTSSFQHSWAPAQHASLGALRAAETGRTFVHATLTGVSAVYDPSGHHVGRTLGTSTSATAVYEVPLANGRTLYARYGDWTVYAALLTLAAYAVTLRLRRTPRARPARTAHASPARPVR
ncbi:apolipoprotein N-acyltransferase [Streptomyces acidiscabies]|uniref:Apolipoprotein N-acyltransferase n=1 Tax=Streptomyces acidiscabies TaxID=42234 RepID=A0AAP6BJJ0_9ACTN|nr:apolipoprotein N-acyltransferase [Streptomyces acidiscabies]MDX2965936.1 apolipoprotein N-acyltransferase [Streptomyces acidiscabies]MDX3024776.1 apolipoprotein N-acyltransferase [Streptomyces acidiscabies]MDX3795762.1 apolipoprotein N-acyltransferase [Streptomyces acidiscabies]